MFIPEGEFCMDPCDDSLNLFAFQRKRLFEYEVHSFSPFCVDRSSQKKLWPVKNTRAWLQILMLQMAFFQLKLNLILFATLLSWFIAYKLCIHIACEYNLLCPLESLAPFIKMSLNDYKINITHKIKIATQAIIYCLPLVLNC